MKALNRQELSYKLGATFKFQQDIIACQDKFRTVVKPRQAGMTTAFAIEALLDALIHDNYVICIVSPTLRQSHRMMRYIKKAFRKLEKELNSTIPTEKFTSEEIIFHHGSEIYSLPNNPQGIQGIDANHAIVDEGGLFGTQEGEEIMDALIGSLSAKGGRFTISGKPKGKRGMIWQFWDKSNERYNEFTHFKLTWKDRANQDKLYGEEVAKHKKILTKLQFAETYDAEFVDEGVLVFTHELLEMAQALFKAKGFTLMHSDGTPQTEAKRYVGIDFGRKRNLTEIHVLEKFEDKILRTLMMKSLEKMNFEDQKTYIDDLIVRVRPYQVRVDERGMGLPLLDYLVRKHGENMIKPLNLSNQKTKEHAVLQCRNAFTDSILAIPEHEKLYDQLHSFQREYTEHGNVRYFGKVDETDFLDDKVIALIAAVDAAQSTPFQMEII